MAPKFTTTCQVKQTAIQGAKVPKEGKRDGKPEIISRILLQL